MTFINIQYEKHNGTLNIETNEVMFYHFKYIDITEAVRRLEKDIEQSEEELKIFDELFKEMLLF
jgi:hypothetical protein